MLQVQGVGSFLDMVKLAFPLIALSPGNDGPAAAPAAAAGGASVTAEQAATWHAHRGDDDDYDYDRK